MRYSTFLLLFTSAGLLLGQPVSIGVKGGGRLTADLNSYFATSESKRYVVGAMATVSLPAGFRLEFDALYRRVGYRWSGTDPIGDQVFERDRGNSWEFPILIRRTLWPGIYASVGYAPRVINGSGHVDGIVVESLIPPIKTYSERDILVSWSTTHGVVGAAGIEKRLGPVRIAPEVRYVYWNRPAQEVYGSRGFSIVSTRHQVDLLVGISIH